VNNKISITNRELNVADATLKKEASGEFNITAVHCCIVVNVALSAFRISNVPASIPSKNSPASMWFNPK
jgi:hypothetical protein